MTEIDTESNQYSDGYCQFKSIIIGKSNVLDAGHLMETKIGFRNLFHQQF